MESFFVFLTKRYPFCAQGLLDDADKKGETRPVEMTVEGISFWLTHNQSPGRPKYLTTEQEMCIVDALKMICVSELPQHGQGAQVSVLLYLISLPKIETPGKGGLLGNTH